MTTIAIGIGDAKIQALGSVILQGIQMRGSDEAGGVNPE